MVNYYKQFKTFVEQNKLKDKVLLSEFEQYLMIYFGLSEKGMKRWLGNFQSAGLINMEKDKNEIWYVKLL